MVWFGFMVFNATFNNISVISWRSVKLVEETRVPVENHRSVASPGFELTGCPIARAVLNLTRASKILKAAARWASEKS
jgi:hypothetical protein